MKIEIRNNCKVCSGSLPKRYRTYCSKQCRIKAEYLRYKEYRLKKQQEYQDARSSIRREGKIQCKICGRWYVQLGTHIVQKHGMTAREYREEYNLPVKKGIVPIWYSKEKGYIALKNKTYKNLEKGKKFQYKKGDERAKKQTYWKGKLGKGMEKKREEIYGE